MTEKTSKEPTRDASAHSAPTRNPDWESYTPDGHGRTDEQIRADIHQVLSSDPARSAVAVTVADGMVTLTGEFVDDADRQRLCEDLRDLPSVRGLNDQSSVRGS